MIRIDLYLSEKQLEKLRQISKETGLSVSEHIRRAVDLYIGSTENDKRQKTEINNYEILGKS